MADSITHSVAPDHHSIADLAAAPGHVAEEALFLVECVLPYVDPQVREHLHLLHGGRRNLPQLRQIRIHHFGIGLHWLELFKLFPSAREYADEHALWTGQGRAAASLSEVIRWWGSYAIYEAAVVRFWIKGNDARQPARPTRLRRRERVTPSLAWDQIASVSDHISVDGYPRLYPNNKEFAAVTMASDYLFAAHGIAGFQHLHVKQIEAVCGSFEIAVEGARRLIEDREAKRKSNRSPRGGPRPRRPRSKAIRVPKL